jgi:hypothetical protein
MYIDYHFRCSSKENSFRSVLLHLSRMSFTFDAIVTRLDLHPRLYLEEGKVVCCKQTLQQDRVQVDSRVSHRGAFGDDGVNPICRAVYNKYGRFNRVSRLSCFIDTQPFELFTKCSDRIGIIALYEL